MTVRVHVALLVTLLTVATGCAKRERVQLARGEPARVAELWQEPTSPRDLFYGPGGEQLAPKTRTFEFVAQDTSGWSPGFDVRDATGLEWSAKLGPEAQAEVATSRILWGLGYHQPALYYLDTWTLTGAQSGNQPEGRFRPELPNQRVVGEWSWYENPFVGTPEFGGLIVANVILNNWDWKASNNKIYQLADATGVQRWFVVRDVGASLGRTTYPGALKWFRLRGFGQGTRNDLPGFESQSFIARVENGRVEFDYQGIYRDVLNTVGPADVRWACRRLSALTDRQWQDAFHAAGYTPEQAKRYITKIRSKIDQGLTLLAAG